jgi:hypothetical protein
MRNKRALEAELPPVAARIGPASPVDAPDPVWAFEVDSKAAPVDLTALDAALLELLLSLEQPHDQGEIAPPVADRPPSKQTTKKMAAAGQAPGSGRKPKSPAANNHEYRKRRTQSGQVR